MPCLRVRRKAVWLEQSKISHPSHEDVLHLHMFVSSKTQGLFIPASQKGKGRFLKWRIPSESGCMGLESPGQGAGSGCGGAGRANLYLSPFTWAPGEGVSPSLHSSAVQSPPQPGWEVRPCREQSGLQPLRSLGSGPSLGFPERWLREQLHTQRPCSPEVLPGPLCLVCSPMAMGAGRLDFCLESTAGAQVASLWGIAPVGSTPASPGPLS